MLYIIFRSRISCDNERFISIIINNSGKQFMMPTLLIVMSMAINLHRVSMFFYVLHNNNKRIRRCQNS